MKSKILLMILFFHFQQLSAASDSTGYDLLKCRLKIDIRDLSAQVITGEAELLIKKKSDEIEKLIFYLKELQVDSVIVNNHIENYSRKGEQIIIPCTMNNDTQLVKIFYHGKPTRDSYWGGFYFSNADGGYAYNLGVAFKDVPHCYGRAWFPSPDNFTDKAFYEFEIITSGDKMAVCNGILTGKTVHPDNSISWFWKLNQPVPSYLVSLAVGNYTLVKWTHKGTEKNIDIINACLAADSVKLKKSFANLNDCISIFEHRYLPYQFDRVGFVMVPFNQGAMEHATNIAYPKYAIDGTLNYETLMAHEFSHHWWGNLLTCETAEDMWINEGWARWSEWLFLEEKYGKEAYQQAFLENHKNVLQFAHIRDNQVLPVSPIPADVTYGAHVYDKGADVVHTLRNFLGDSLFFYAINKILNNNKFANINSYQFRDSLSKYSGMNLHDFFDNWVFEKGFPNFRAELLNNNEETEIKIYQNLRFTDKLYKNVPIEVSFYGKNNEKCIKKIVLTQTDEIFKFDLPFKPVFVVLNEGMKLAEAKTSSTIKIHLKGSYELSDALITINVNEIRDTALVHVEHHWTAPVKWPSSVTGIRFSDYRYWTVDGNFPEVFDANARIKYNGKEGTITGDNYLDHTLNIQHEDSLVVLYRDKISSSWQIYPDYKLITGSKTDKIGVIEIYHLKKGDYCLAVRDAKQGIKSSGYVEPEKINYCYQDNHFVFKSPQNLIIKKIICYDTFGKKYEEMNIPGTSTVSFNASELPEGFYIFQLLTDNQSYSIKTIKP